MACCSTGKRAQPKPKCHQRHHKVKLITSPLHNKQQSTHFHVHSDQNLQSCLKIENKPIMPVTYHCDFLGSKLLSPFQGPLLSSKKKHMEAVQSNTTERAQRSPRPPTISQHGRSRAGHEEPADPTENQAVLRQERYWLQSLVCSCTSLSQLGTKVSLRGSVHLHRTTSEGKKKKCLSTQGKKKRERRISQSVKLDCVDRLDPTLPHKRVRESMGYVTYCDFSL